MSVSTATAERLLGELRQSFNVSTLAGDVKKSQSLLSQLRIELTNFNLYPPFPSDTSSVKQQLTIAREALEYGCFLSIAARDVKAFDRYVNQVKPFYNDYGDLLPPSDRESSVLGLYLLSLLARNQIADFHTELEYINAQSHSGNKKGNNVSQSEQVKFAVQLEQYLMEGAYNKILNARKQVPNESYALFMEQLAETVRDKIAECSEIAYDRVPVAEASKLFMMSNASDLSAYAQKRGWTVSGSDVLFNGAREDAVTIDGWGNMQRTLEYANELERIV